MRMGLLITIIGIAIITSGIIFYLQGNSLVGPTYSFMYSSPQWIVNGQLIFICGLVTLVIGLELTHYTQSHS